MDCAIITPTGEKWRLITCSEISISLVFGGSQPSIIPVMLAKGPSYRRRPRLTGEGRYPVIVSAEGGLFHWTPAFAGETSEAVNHSDITAKVKHNSEHPFSILNFSNTEYL